MWIAGLDGRRALRWVPVGMPHIPAELTRCVFFLYEHDPSQSGSFLGPGGTGFIVARQSYTIQRGFHFYGVTNRHVANPCSTIRLNTKSGSVRFIERDPSQWIWSETDDLAATDITDEFSPEEDEVWCVPDYSFVDPLFYSSQVNIGDPTIMLGLFSDHDGGGDRNLPVGRFGNVAALPDPLVPVRLSRADKHVRPAFLNDMRSRSGFSGSPVWTWDMPYEDTSPPSHGGTSHIRRSQRPVLRLIGVHRGQFRESAAVLPSDKAPRRRAQKLVDVASSMTVVVPAWEITKLLDDRRFEAQRNARDARADRVAKSDEYAALIRAQEGDLPRRLFIYPPSF